MAKSTPIKDRPAQNGDWTAVYLEGYEFARIKIPGQSDELKMLFKTQLAIEIGGKRGIPWLDDEIIGMKIGESKTCHPIMPRDFINPPFEEDREIEAKIRLLWIETKEIPELTDEFLETNKIAKDMIEFKGHVKVDLEANARAVEDREAVVRIQDWLMDNVKFSLPEDILEEKKEEIIEKLRQEYQRQGEDLDMLLKRVDERATKARHEIERLAEEQARLDFIVNDIAEKESITVDQTDILNHVQIVAQQAQLKKHQVQKLMEDSLFLVSVYRTLLTRKVSNFLLNHSKREYFTEEEEKSHHMHEPSVTQDKPDSGGLIITGS
jgi:trigger factor